MRKCNLLGAVLLLGLVGCTDTVDTITREYRNQNNEVIDALTMIKDDASAKRYHVRVFGPMVQRYQGIDARLNIVRTNRIKKDFVKEVLESDGFQLYLADMEVNRQRFGLEMTRLRNLINQYLQRERERLISEGEADPKVDPVTVCPGLFDVVFVEANLDPLRQQLNEPKLLTMASNFPQWKIADYDKMYAKFVERRKVFAPPPFKLVN